MAHVKIVNNNQACTFSVVVDGVELAHSLLHEGFRIVPADLAENRPAEVHMVVAADVLEVDLPDAVVVATCSDVA